MFDKITVSQKHNVTIIIQRLSFSPSYCTSVFKKSVLTKLLTVNGSKYHTYLSSPKHNCVVIPKMPRFPVTTNSFSNLSNLPPTVL